MKNRLSVILMTAAAAIVFVLMLHITAFADNKGNAVPLEPQNGIPLVIIRIDESDGTIAEMNGSEDHSVRCTGTAEIKVPEGYTGEYGSVSVPEGEVELEFIRGRGNSTWDTEENSKKPYKIKYKKKQKLFGMGSNKEWALMANANDETMLKNRIVSWLGEQMAFDYTPQMIPVDVVMIGSSSGAKELGSYCLSELVSVGDNRLDIDGAKLLAIYNAVQNEGDPFFKTDRGVRIKYEDPEEENKQVESFVKDLEKRIMDPEVIDSAAHAAIAGRMDLRSAANYWWIQEFVCNNDAFCTSSTYMYINPDTAINGNNTGWKLFWGPLWDFDLIFNVTGTGDEADTRYGFNNTDMLWFDRLRQDDPEFVSLLKEQWRDLDPMLTELTREGGKLDRMKEEIRASWERDYEIWEYYYDPWAEEKMDLDKEVEKIRTWMVKRQAWINDNIDTIGTVYHTVTYTADGKVIGTESVREGSGAMAEIEAPEKDGYLFVRWQERETGVDLYEVNVKKDITVDAVFIREEDSVKPEAVYFSRSKDWVSLSDEEYYGSYMEVFPEDAVSPKVTWTSSDESVAAVDKYGNVTLLSEGVTTISATLYNGVSGSYELHVYDPEKVSAAVPAGFAAQPHELTLKPGQTEQIGYSLLPDGGVYPDCMVMYRFKESDCIKYNESLGAVTGVKPVKTTVTLHLYTSDRNIEFTDQCTVTVKGGSIAGAKVVLSKTAFMFNGKIQKPVVKTINGLSLKKGTDYTVRWSNASSRNVGSYTVTITGKGDYTGTVKATYKIRPKGTSIKSLKKDKNAVTVKWKKQPAKMSKSRITGYQIQLATDRKFTRNKKTVTVKGYNKVAKKVTKLKGDKKYYVRIRTYKTVKGVKCFSPWSKAKTVKTR